MISREGCVCVASERPDVLLELLRPARELAEGSRRALHALLLGPDAATVASEAAARGAAVTVVEAPERDLSRPLICLEALAAGLGSSPPDILLIGATTLGAEVAARLAQRHGAACANECTDLALEGRSLRIERRCLGRFVAGEVLRSRPAIATVRPRLYEPPEPAAMRGSIDTLRLDLAPSPVRVREQRARPASDVRIEDADVIVSVGRGLARREDLGMIDDLAAALGGVVGASRPLADHLHWLPVDRKVGLSGHTVSPELYVACGISGQIEHVVGMREARVVVAINTDPEAPIMLEADYCVVADIYALVPALTEALASAR